MADVPVVTPDVIVESLPEVLPVVTPDTSAEQDSSYEETPTPADESTADTSAALEAVVDESLTTVSRIDHTDDLRSHKD